MELKLFIRFGLVLSFLALLIIFVFHFWLLLMPFFIAYILQFALRPIVIILEQKGLKHSFAVTTVFVVFFGIFALFLHLFIPAVITELLGIQDNFPEYSRSMSKKIDEFNTLFLGKFSDISNILSEENYADIKVEIGGYIADTLLGVIKKLPVYLFSVLPLILYIFVIPFATFFFLLDDRLIKKKIISMVLNRYFETTLNLIYSLNLQFGWLLRGMFISAVIISTLASTGLWIIGLEYPILVGIFSGLANLIPYVGPIAGSIAAILVAMMTGSSPMFFLYIILVFLIVNLIDNVLVQPMVLARAAKLHPLVVIFLVLFGSKIGGIIGMLFAVPIASILQVIITILYNELTRPIKPDFSKYTDIV